MSLKTRKKHRNQNKDTQDCPRLDAHPSHQSRQSSRQEQALIRPGNRSGTGGEADPYTLSSLSAPGPHGTLGTPSGEPPPSRGNRQGGDGKE